MADHRRAFVALVVSAILCGPTTVIAPAAPTIAPAIRADARAAYTVGRKVDLRAIPFRAAPVKATRRDHPRNRSAFRSPETAPAPPYRAKHDRDPLAVRLFSAKPHLRLPRGIGGPQRSVDDRHHGPPTPRPTPTSSARPVGGSPVFGSGPGATGMYPWWSFEAQAAFSAMGNANVNVANGNLVLTTTDIGVPHVGIDLLLARTYNSMSQYDVNGTDGSQPTIFGNGWTSNLDVHMALNAAGGVTIYDAVGTRWDYNPDADGNWVKPAGQYAALWYNASNQEYYWTLKDGITYQFRSPTCTVAASVCGRIHYIYGRNNNTYLHFSYGFSSPDFSFASMTSVTVATETGQNLYLYVNPINGHPLVTSVVPNSQSINQVRFDYDNAGNLTLFTEAPNNDAGTTPTIGYSYYPGGSQLQYVTSPLYANGHGAYIGFQYSTGAVSEVDLYGEVNPSSFDGVTSGPIQSGPQGVYLYEATQYLYGVGGWTYVTDSDGHQRRYLPNADASISTRLTYTGAQFLSTTTTWDQATHNLSFVTDQRGATINFEYDARGNVLTKALASVGVYAGGSHGSTTMRPTFRYVYDGFDNLVATCGPAWSHAHGSDYGNPSGCVEGAAGATTFTWQWVETEPQLRLYRMTDPTGYQYTWSYDAAAQGGTDLSLPTEITGTTFAQQNSPGGTSITPDQKFSYDASGNLACYNDSIGITAFTYDALNRLVSMSDPDDNVVACARPTGAYQTTLLKTYFPNGLLKAAGGSFSHSLGMDTSYTYDLDGNRVTTTAYPSNVASVTRKYYDGADRLIEVTLPHTALSDAVQDVQSYPWLTRYLFDNSGGYAQSEAGIGSFYAYGRVYKVQELQGSNMVDLRVVTHDAADRVVSSYAHTPNSGPNVWRNQTNTYDTFSPGDVATTYDSGGNSEQFAYDALGRVTNVQLVSGQTATPTRTYGFDEEGRTVLTRSGRWGDEWTTYDAYTGRTLSRTEANQGGLSAPGTFSYAYFPNGWSRSSSFVGGAMNGILHDQWYNNDGSVSGQNLYNGTGSILSTVTNTFTRGRRLIQRADSTTPNASVVTLDAYGRPQASAMRAGTYSQIGYDAEGNVTTFNAMSGHVVTNTYNERNELASSVWALNGGTDKAYPNMRQHGNNGVMQHDLWACTTGNVCSWNSAGELVDLFSGAVTYADYVPPGSDNDLTSSYQYDTIGRLNRTLQDFPGNRFSYTGTSTKTYDAEDRLTSDSYSNWGEPTGYCGQTTRGATPKMTDRTLSYDWGPDGHPVRYSDSSRGTTETLHWEGSSLSFTTNSAGQLDDLKFGNMADYTPRDQTYAGLTFWDRDPFGTIASAHNGTGFGMWTASSAAHGACTISGAPGDSAGYVGPASFGWVAGQTYRYQSKGLLLGFTADGISDGFNNTNGVRTLSGQSQAWTVPDPYVGVPESPQSQKSYVYAANNPASNGDPSGYLSVAQQQMLGAYLQQYKYAENAVDDRACTSFIVHAYQQAIGINLHDLIAEDYKVNPNGYEWGGFHGRGELRVGNLHNYFYHMGELHAWDGNVNKRVGDWIFFKQTHKEYSGETGGLIEWTEPLVHMVTVSKVNANGEILEIAEGTGGKTEKVPWKVFLERLKAQGYSPQDWARIEAKVQLIHGAIMAQNFMSGDDPYGGLSPYYGNLRYY